mgnify:CR=1 FL=1
MANTKEQISRNMKSNKGKDTKPELLLRKELWRRGLRYRKNYKELYGKPDIVFLGARIAVFVDVMIGNTKKMILKVVAIIGFLKSSVISNMTTRSRRNLFPLIGS